MRKAIGFLWFLIWISSGTFLSYWLILNHLKLMEWILPILLIGWSVLLFLGHSLLERIFKKMTKAP